MKRLALVLILVALPAAADEPDGDARIVNGLRLSHPRTYRLRVTVEMTARDAAREIVATAPLPIDWPEQTVKLVDERRPSGGVTKVRRAAGKADVLVCSLAGLPAGAAATFERTYEITRYRAECAVEPESLRIPAQVKPDMREFLASAPGIELKHPKVKALHAELQDAGLSAWDQARRHFDWVRANLQFQLGEYRGAAKALQTKQGDCEDYTALFVALCRLSQIPARSVWVEGHAYAEFYLEDAEGTGCWAPCELTGAGSFGRASDTRPILQKGDEFADPLTRRTQRYVPQSLKALGGPLQFSAARTVVPGKLPPAKEN